MNHVSFCSHCGTVQITTRDSLQCAHCHVVMRTQSKRGNGIRKGLLSIYAQFFWHNQTFIPVIVDEQVVTVITSDAQCPELERFQREHQFSDRAFRVVLGSQAALGSAKSVLFSLYDFDGMTDDELAEFTDAVIQFPPQ